VVREHNNRPFYEAKFRHAGRQVKRRIGPAWLERDPDSGQWQSRKGRVPDGAFDERGARQCGTDSKIVIAIDGYLDETVS